MDASIVERSKVADLFKEAGEIVSITVSSLKTARGLKQPKSL
jgi:hypothetical protein